MLFNMAFKAAKFRGLVSVMPTKKERMARNGKEKTIPIIRQSGYLITAL